MSEQHSDDGLYDDEVWCPHCQGYGTITCYCGGDQCYCDNFGDAPCPVCHGEQTVSDARADTYWKKSAENAKAMKEIWEKHDPMEPSQ